jgi:hypothetical protein
LLDIFKVPEVSHCCCLMIIMLNCISLTQVMRLSMCFTKC